MPSLWLLLMIFLAPIMQMTSIAPALCQKHVTEKRQPFLMEDNLQSSSSSSSSSSSGRSYQEMHFNLNFSCVWSGGVRNSSPCFNAMKILPKNISLEKTNIYSKTEEFISKITRLLPESVNLNVTGVVKHGQLDMKNRRKNQRIEKRLQIGIYHRHNIDPSQDLCSWDRDDLSIQSRESNESKSSGALNLKNTNNIEIRDNQSQMIVNGNCTYKSIDTLNCLDDIIAQFRLSWPVHLWLPQNFATFNAHWLQFPPPSPAAHYTLAVLYAVIMVFGVFGNTFAIYMFLRCRPLRTPANILVMNLAISDLILLCKMPVFIYNSIYMGPALGNFACQVYGFLGGMTGTVSIVTLASIAADRYNVVAEPFRRTTYARARITVALTWVYGATFAGLPLLIPSLGGYKPEGYLTSCSFDYLTHDPRVKAFILCFFVAAWVLPFCLISFCYLGILRVVMAARHMNIGDQVAETSNKHCREEEKRRTELRLAFVVIGIIGMWFVSWSPYAVVALLGVSGQSHLVTPLASMVPALFCKTASCLDPYVYAVTHPRFRSELHHLTKRSRRKRSARQWSPQHRRQIVGPRVSRVQDDLDNGVEEEIQCLERIEIISTASRRSTSMWRDTTNCSSVKTTSCSYQSRGGERIGGVSREEVGGVADVVCY